ncbi:MAG: putative methyltransferase [Gammaproteobacteria bacterium]|jgi:predicted methyltransferase
MRHVFTILILLFLSVQIIAQEQSPILQKAQDAMASEIRSEEDKVRDIYRKPDQVLEFFGLKDDMRVIEILPFGGWYTKILGPILRNNGQLYTTQPDLGRYSDALEPTLALPGMDRVIKLDYNGRTKNSEDERWIGTRGNWDVEPVDLVLTFQNYHNYNYEDRMTLNKTVFNALKPGGSYGIVDHTRRHMEPGVRINRRRFDPVLLIKEVQESGFDFVDYSDLLAMSDDELTLEVGQPQVSGRSDRFTLLFRKPE